MWTILLGRAKRFWAKYWFLIILITVGVVVAFIWGWKAALAAVLGGVGLGTGIQADTEAKRVRAETDKVVMDAKSRVDERDRRIQKMRGRKW